MAICLRNEHFESSFDHVTFYEVVALFPAKTQGYCCYAYCKDCRYPAANFITNPLFLEVLCAHWSQMDRVLSVFKTEVLN